MNAAPQTRPATSRPATSRPASPLTRAYDWVKRRSAFARTRRSLADLDARTLRDIGITRRDLAVYSVTRDGR